MRLQLSILPAPRASVRRLVAALAVVAAPHALAGQTRTVQRHDVSEPEGRLLAFYSAALAFSPAGAAPPAAGRAAGAVDLGVELSYIPRLTEAQRSAGFDKPEATNLAPLVPRPRATVALPGGAALELGWLPPARVFGVRAQLLSLALATPAVGLGTFLLSARGAYTAGRVRGPITCNGSLARHPSRDLRLYFASVCYGSESDDHFEPRQLGAELLARPAAETWHGLVPYAGAGARAQHARFDIGVIRRDGSRDPDEPILESRAVRGYGFAGASRALGGRGMVGGELYYEPGSLLTARVIAGVRVRRGAAGAR